jgi:hypothetical protein
VQVSAVRAGVFWLRGLFLVPRSSSTPVAGWAWPTWVVSRRRVVEAVFVLLEFPSPSRRIFIGSHSPPHLWFAISVLQPADTWQVGRACVRRTRSAAMAWPCDEVECYMTYMPLRGLYHNLSARGSVVSYLARRDSYILALGFPGKPSFRTACHFLAT